MCELLTPLITVVSGVLVYVITEILKEIWLQPLQTYKKLKGKVVSDLTLYANFYSNPLNYNCENKELVEKYNLASDELRKDASELRAFVQCMYCIHFGIPKAKNIMDASSFLIGLSNSFYKYANSEYKENYNLRNNIYEKLKIKRY